MNFLILSDEPRLCAEYHADVHLNSQLKEAVQVLSTVYGGPYKPTHQNHPCTKWVAASPVNAAWALTLARELHAEWLHRFGKPHGSGLLLPEVSRRMAISRVLTTSRTPFAQVMPEQYRVDGDAVTAYRAYYNAEKQGFWVRRAGQPPRWRAAKWTRRPEPAWFIRQPTPTAPTVLPSDSAS